MESAEELFDGVLPADYPDVYYGILRTFCLKTDHIIYMCPGARKMKLCVRCFNCRSLVSRQHFRRCNGWHSVTTFTARALNDITKCIDCGEVLVTVGSPAECRHCISTFILNEQVFNRSRYGYEWDNNNNLYGGANEAPASASDTRDT